MEKLKNHYINYLVKYTLLFFTLSIFVFSWYFFTGKTFVYNGDGKNQYLPIYIYWSNYLREFLKNIFINHTFLIKQWDFSIGEGCDIIPTLSYNIVGDPFCFLSFLVPAKHMYIYYSAMSLLRLYVAGIAFSYLCFYKKQKNKTAILAGSLSYVFFHYAIYNVAKHPHFLNVMIYFPLIIVGVEKIINNESPVCFIVSVFIAALTSFYFFYMEVILTILYVIARLINVYKKNFKTIITFIFKYLVYGLTGTCMAAAVLFPTIYEILKDSRQGMANNSFLFYSYSYYIELLSTFFTTSTNISYSKWICLGFSVPTLIAVYHQITSKNKEDNFLKELILFSLIIVTIPVFGLILNGFQYPSHRYCWAIALLYSYILVTKWDKITTETKYPKFIFIAFFILLIFAILYTGINNFINEIIQIANAIIFVLLITHAKKTKISNNSTYIVFISLSISIFTNSFFIFSKYGKNFASRGTKPKELELVLNNETKSIQSIENKENKTNSFFRYSGHKLTEDVSMVSGLSAIQHYISLTNPKIQEFRKNIEINQSGLLHRYQSYDDRVFLDAISAVKYYFIPKDENFLPPYGFYKTEEQTIYKNNKNLPLAFTYNKCIPTSEWNLLNPIEKQEVLLQNVILNDKTNLSENSPTLNLCKVIPINIRFDNDIIKTEKGFLSTKENTHVYISFDGLRDSETYLRLSGLDFENVNEYDLAKMNNTHLSTLKKIKFFIKKILDLKKTEEVIIDFKSPLNNTKNLVYYTKYYTWYANRHNFCINMGYSKEAVSWIDITLSEPGLYHLENLEVFCQPMTNYENQILERRKFVLENEKISTNRITGNISVPDTRFLYFSIPYTEGWKAKVDGKFVKIHQANIMHMGIEIEKGEHNIELIYHTPLLKISFIISLFAFVIFIMILLYQNKNKQ